MNIKFILIMIAKTNSIKSHMTIWRNCKTTWWFCL